MEEPISVRYTFLMMLAIADPSGVVVGTDVAIARRLNMPMADFVNSVRRLMEPDENSNSKEEEGRRVVVSDGERGYQLVNFLKYRNLRDEDQKREYMRNYMKSRRSALKSVNACKDPLTEVIHAEEDAEATAKEDATPKPPSPEALELVPLDPKTKSPETPEGFEEFWNLYPRKVAKSEAVKAFRKVPKTSLLAILDDLDRRVGSTDWIKDNGRFVPHPATYLRQERWKDESVQIATSPKSVHDLTDRQLLGIDPIP